MVDIEHQLLIKDPNIYLKYLHPEFQFQVVKINN